MRGTWKLFLIVVLVICLCASYFIFRKKDAAYSGSPGEVVDLVFELDKKLEFGEYYFDLDNGKTATYHLCYCLTDRNMFPPDCTGDVKYIYSNTPGSMCVPLRIGTGNCSVQSISSSSFATMFMIPLEYSWTKPYQKILMGIRIPEQASPHSTLAVAVTLFKVLDGAKMVKCRDYEKIIKVKAKAAK